MHPTRTASVWLLTIGLSCAGVLLVVFDSARSQETKPANLRIKELGHQRVAVLKEIHETTKQLFEGGRMSAEEVVAADRELFAARLADVDTRKDRIDVCREALRTALEWQTKVKEWRAAGRVTAVAVLKAEAYVLEIRITREKAEAEE